MAPMAKPFSIGNAPVYRPGPGEILIKAHSVAVVCPDNRGIINLLTMTNASSLWAESRRLEDTVSTHTSAKHVMSSFIWRDSGRYLRTYPFLLGRDAAGTVEEVGEGVTRFHKGQRVIASVSPKPNGLYPFRLLQDISTALSLEILPMQPIRPILWHWNNLQLPFHRI